MYGRLTMTKKPGRYRSTAMVRNLRLQRLKETTMSRTAALDVRQAAKTLEKRGVPNRKSTAGRKGHFRLSQKCCPQEVWGMGKSQELRRKRLVLHQMLRR